MSLVLVVGALPSRTLRNWMSVDAGFSQDGILVVNPIFAAPVWTRNAARPCSRRSRTGWRRSRAWSPRRRPSSCRSAARLERQHVIGGQKQKDKVNFNRVSASYFKTMGTPILAGATSRHDTAGGEKVVIVTEPSRGRSSPAELTDRSSKSRKIRGSRARSTGRWRREEHEIHRPARRVYPSGSSPRRRTRSPTRSAGGAVEGTACHHHAGGRRR